MEDLFLGAAIIGIVIFGFYLMKRLDRFMKRHYKRRPIVPDPNESGVMIFNSPNARPEDGKKGGKPEDPEDEEDRGEDQSRRSRQKNMQMRGWDCKQNSRTVMSVEYAGALCYDKRRS